MRQFLNRKFLQESVSVYDYLIAFLIAVAASLIVFGLEQITVERFSNISSVLILAVLISAILFGTGPALLAAAMCSIFYDWLAVPPFLETTSGYDNLVKFSIFVVAALLTGGIAGFAKASAVQVKRREGELNAAWAEQEKLRRQREKERLRREVESLRNAILTSVSHDLKSPLASIIGAMSSLKLSDRQLTERHRHDLAETALSEANRLLRHIDNILNVAKLTGDEPVIRRDSVALDDVIDLTVKRLAIRLRRFRLQIDQDDQLSCRGDERLLDIALGNLVDNAIKHSPDGSLITIRCRLDPKLPDVLMLQVEDEGVGLSDQDDAGPFACAEQGPPDAPPPGGGLGLWISRRIVEAHGGTVSLGPGRSGRGTLATIVLPQRPDDHSSWAGDQDAA